MSPETVAQGAMHIGGRPYRRSDAAAYDVFEPALGKPLAHVPSATGEDVDAAVGAALAAAPSWRALGPQGRAQVVRRLAGAVRDAAEELATLDARNSGNPIGAMRFDALKAAEALDFFAGASLQLGGQTIPASADHLHYTVREPFGVVGVITAFNHPILFAAARTAAAMVAGNCVVLKPAEQTPLSALRFAEIAAGILPPGVLNVITGGAGAGDALVRHPQVRRLNFTGSLATALRIQEAAAASRTIKRLGLQLGGKNPLIVLPDVEIEEAAAAAIDGMNLFKVMGQSCGSTSRAFVHRSQVGQFEQAVAARLEGLRMGDPLDAQTQIGPLVSEAQRERVERMVAAGLAEGARLVSGGRRPDIGQLSTGFFYTPTLLSEVGPSMRIGQEEVFGPVLSVIPWTDEAEMVGKVNDVRYGLTASIYTHDLTAAHRLAAAVDVGYVWVNDVEKRWVGVPFGGHKDSGTSLEFSVDELLANSQLKAISVKLT